MRAVHEVRGGKFISDSSNPGACGVVAWHLVFSVGGCLTNPLGVSFGGVFSTTTLQHAEPFLGQVGVCENVPHSSAPYVPHSEGGGYEEGRTYKSFGDTQPRPLLIDRETQCCEFELSVRLGVFTHTLSLLRDATLAFVGRPQQAATSMPF